MWIVLVSLPGFAVFRIIAPICEMQKMRCLLTRHLGYSGLKHLVGHEDGVDDVNDAVRLEHICRGDCGHAALSVGQHDLAAGHRGGEVFALYGLEGGFAAARFDHLGKLFRADLAGNDVVGEDLDEGILVLRLDEGFDGAGRKLGKGVIGWREDGEGSGAVEGVNQTAGLDGCDEGLVDRRVDCVLDDGLGGVHGGSANGWVLLSLGAE